MADEDEKKQLKATITDLLSSKGPPNGPLKESELKRVLTCVNILVDQRLEDAELLESFTESELIGFNIPAGVARTLKKAFPGPSSSTAAPTPAGASADDESIAAFDRLAAELKAVLLSFFNTIHPLLRQHIAASSCSSARLALLTHSFNSNWNNTPTHLDDVLYYFPFEPPDQRSRGAPPTVARMIWGPRETESMPEALSIMREWVNDDELLIIDVSSRGWLSFQNDLVEVIGSKRDIIGFHSKILDQMYPSDLAALKDGTATPALLLKVAYAVVFAYETKRTDALGTSGAWDCRFQAILQFILLNHLSNAWRHGSEIPVIGGDLWPVNSILVQSFPEGDAYGLQVVVPSEGDGLDMQKFVVRAIQRRKHALWDQYQRELSSNTIPSSFAGAGGNTSNHGNPAGSGGGGGTHIVPGSSYGGASLTYSGAAGGNCGPSAGATGLAFSSCKLGAEYQESLTGLEEEDLNTATQNMLMQLLSRPETRSSFGLAAPPTLDAISQVDVEEFLRKAGQALARKVIQQQSMAIRDVSANTNQDH